MPKNKPLPEAVDTSIEASWREGDEIAATREVVRKYARVLDMTDSGRDIKPLASGMFEAIDRLKALEEAEAARDGDTPLSGILAMAEAADA